MQDMQLRPMRPEDAEQVARIDNLIYAKGMTADQARREASRFAHARPLVAHTSDAIVGYVFVWYVADAAEIHDVAVHPDYRQRGVARRLLNQVFATATTLKCRELRLEVRAANEAALALYRSLGFIATGRRKGYYADTGEDAVLMAKTLEESQNGMV